MGCSTSNVVENNQPAKPLNALETCSETAQKHWLKVKEMHSKSTAIRKSDIVDEFYEKGGVKYLIKFLRRDEIQNKVIEITKPLDERKDPFAPPIEEGVLIEENFTDSHRICFNKFPIVDHHVILATRDFMDQYTHLTVEALLNRVTLGYGFFNGGMNAGASQAHKHLQSVPYEHKKDYGIFKYVQDENNLEKITNLNHNDVTFWKLKIFNFPHIFMKFSNSLRDKLILISEQNRKEIGKTLFEIYDLGLNFLELKKDPVKILADYSFMLTEEWILIVPRKTHEVFLNEGKLNLNSACFTLSILVKSEALKAEIKAMEIPEIFKRLSV